MLLPRHAQIVGNLMALLLGAQNPVVHCSYCKDSPIVLCTWREGQRRCNLTSLRLSKPPRDVTVLGDNEFAVIAPLYQLY